MYTRKTKQIILINQLQKWNRKPRRGLPKFIHLSTQNSLDNIKLYHFHAAFCKRILISTKGSASVPGRKRVLGPRWGTVPRDFFRRFFLKLFLRSKKIRLENMPRTISIFQNHLVRYSIILARAGLIVINDNGHACFANIMDTSNGCYTIIIDTTRLNYRFNSLPVLLKRQ